MGMPYVSPSTTPASSRFASTSAVSRPNSSIVVSMPVSASVETAGLSSRMTSGDVPSCADSSAWFVSAVVSYAVRWMVTPASSPHCWTRASQSDDASCCGYGSHHVYVVLSPPDACPPPAPPDEHAPTRARVAVPRTAVTRVTGLRRVWCISGSSLNESVDDADDLLASAPAVGRRGGRGLGPGAPGRRPRASPVDELGRDEPHDVRLVSPDLPLDAPHELAHGHAAQAVRRGLDRGEGQGERAGELVRVAPDDGQVPRRGQAAVVQDGGQGGRGRLVVDDQAGGPGVRVEERVELAADLGLARRRVRGVQDDAARPRGLDRGVLEAPHVRATALDDVLGLRDEHDLAVPEAVEVVDHEAAGLLEVEVEHVDARAVRGQADECARLGRGPQDRQALVVLG